MPLEVGMWRIDNEISKLQSVPMEQEERLEDILDKNISITLRNWMVIGRQVFTDYGNYIDLLAIDQNGYLVVIELKKDKTPREVVAQLIDYGSWVKDLNATEIAGIYNKYVEKYHSDKSDLSFDDVFKQHFQVQELPENINESYEMIVIAASMDQSTERIVLHLAEDYEVPINVLFFRVFKDEGREYMSFAWLKDPYVQDPVVPSSHSIKGTWNGESYVSFGHGERRRWDDAVKYGFISAGGGTWYSSTLTQLNIGDRIWVNVPRQGYVGAGEVTAQSVRVDEFLVKQDDGSEVPIASLPVQAPDMFKDKNNDEKAEYLVGVKWIKTVPLEQAHREKGFFGNQNSACKPKAKSWDYTIERLKKHFNIK